MLAASDKKCLLTDAQTAQTNQYRGTVVSLWCLKRRLPPQRRVEFNLTTSDLNNLVELLINEQAEMGESDDMWPVETTEVNDTQLSTTLMPPFFTTSTDHFENVLRVLLSNIKLYYTPALIVAGVLGNCICATVLLTSKLRKLSCTIYLTAIAVTNSSFLAALFVIWLSRLNIQLYNTPGWCQFLTLISCASNFLSSWYMVCLSLDRYIYIYKQKLRTKFCTTLCAKLTVLLIGTIAISIFVNISLTVGVMSIPQGDLCLPVPSLMGGLSILSRIDVFVNAMLPIILIFLMCMLCWVGLYSPERQIERRRASVRTQNNVSSRTPALRLLEAKLTKTCVIIMTLFFLLCAPCQIQRIYCTIRELVTQYQPTNQQYIIQQLLQYPYYTSFAINVLVYLFNLKAFRNALKLVLLRLQYKLNMLKHHRSRGQGIATLASATVIQMSMHEDTLRLRDVSLI